MGYVSLFSPRAPLIYDFFLFVSKVAQSNVSACFKLPRMKMIPFPGCLGIVPTRSCFRIVIPGPARGAQALFTVGPALFFSASEVFLIPVHDPGGDVHGMVCALAGGGCGTTRGSGRWKWAASLRAGGELRGAGVGSGAGSGAAGGGELLSADTPARKAASF